MICATWRMPGVFKADAQKVYEEIAAIGDSATKFDNAMNVTNALVPIKFAEHHVDQKLMSPKRGSPVLVYINRFSGWSAEIPITYTENVYSLDQIVNIINMAGFGLGIGSGRSSGYGRYHVSGIK